MTYLEVFSEPTFTTEPCEGALDDSAPWLGFERTHALFAGDNFDCPFTQICERLEQLPTTIDAIREDMAQLWEHTADDPQQRHCAIVVLNVSCVHQHGQSMNLPYQ